MNEVALSELFRAYERERRDRNEAWREVRKASDELNRLHQDLLRSTRRMAAFAMVIEGEGETLDYRWTDEQRDAAKKFDNEVREYLARAYMPV